MVKKQNSFFIIASFAVFFVYAIYMNIFGPNASVMMSFYDIDAANQGFVLTIQSIGGFITAVVLALYGERFNKIKVLLIGLIIFAVGSILIGMAPSYAMLIVIVVFIGIGLVCVDIMMNGVLTDVLPEKKNTLIPLTHAFYGLGTMVAPFVVIATVNPQIFNTFSKPFLLVGVIAVVISVLYFVTSKKIIPLSPYADKEKMAQHTKGHPAEIFKEKKAWAFLAAGILYFSFQMGIGMWLPTYCTEIVKMNFDTAGVMLSVFFGGALIMRFLGPLFMKYISPKKLFVIFNVFAAGTMVLALSITNIPLMVILFFVSGFMQGSSVACLVIMSVEAFPHRTASASSIAVFSVNIAAMTAPLWMGQMASFTGFLLPMYIICCLMVLSAFIVYKTKIN